MRIAQIVALSLPLAACVEAPDRVDTIDVQKAPPPSCDACGNNGLPQEAWLTAPVALSPVTLGAAGLKVGPSVGPLCDPALLRTPIPGGHACQLNPLWSAWIGGDVWRDYLVRYLAKVAAPKGSRVDDPARGVSYQGEFGLAPAALTSSFGAAEQAILTGALATLVDVAANGVALCLQTPGGPACPSSYAYQEVVGFGNLFAGEHDVVAGGYAALLPEDSIRVCPGAGLACNSYSVVVPYYAAACVYAGPSSHRSPLQCSDPTMPGAPPNLHPVQAFTYDDPAVYGARGGAASGLAPL